MSAPRYPVDAKVWIERAQEDLKWVRHAFEGGFFQQACFGCQQAVEKALKSLLFAYDQPLSRTHSLPGLVDLCEPFDQDIRDFSDTAAILDEYYAPARYPDAAQVDFTEGRARDAIALAERFVEFLRTRVEARLREPN